jgi:7-carboxy-7-deazaguanine synthase
LSAADARSAPASQIAKSDRLRVNEIFYSLQGESDTVGIATAFVRLTGCPLRCRYCDTEYAFYEGDWRSIEDVLRAVDDTGAQFVCVTGGEPLAQANCLTLLKSLCDTGVQVSLETSGAMDIGGVDPRVRVVLDVKTPGSGEEPRNRLDNLQRLRPKDQVKFVICSRSDYDWSKDFIERHVLATHSQVLFSPSYHEIEPRELAEWILADRLPVRFQLQLHKVLWGEARGK